MGRRCSGTGAFSNSIRNEPEFKVVFADIEHGLARQRAESVARPKDAPLDLAAVDWANRSIDQGTRIRPMTDSGERPLWGRLALCWLTWPGFEPGSCLQEPLQIRYERVVFASPSHCSHPH